MKLEHEDHDVCACAECAEVALVKESMNLNKIVIGKYAIPTLVDASSLESECIGRSIARLCNDLFQSVHEETAFFRSRESAIWKAIEIFAEERALLSERASSL